MSRESLFCPLFILSCALMLAGSLNAQAPAQTSTSQAPADKKTQAQETDPLKRPLTAKERKKQAEALKKESAQYGKWLADDVRWIITDEEREAFLKLSTDEERERFIEIFWNVRDPTPDTPENEYKEEHYRRIVYANEHFSAGIPGSKTDRGKIFIMYGPPAEIESHPSGGAYQRPPEEGGGETTTYPFEQWRYRHIDGIGDDIVIEFVDDCMCGAYQMTFDRSRKDALLNVPGAGLTTAEQMGLASKAERFNGGLERLGKPMGGIQGDQFGRLEQFAALNRPPIKFKELEHELVTHTVNVKLVPFDIRADFVKLTSDNDMVPITIAVKNSDITFNSKDGVATGVLNIFGRVSNMTGQVVQTFEDSVQRREPQDLLPRIAAGSSLYWKALMLRPGRYKLEVAVKDLNGDRIGTLTQSLRVPDFGDEKLTSSSLILADQMEKVPASVVGSDSFVIGSTKLRPRVEPLGGQPAVFKRNQRVNFWMQVYNLGIDPQTHKPKATFDYDVVSVATNNNVVHLSEATAEMINPGEQVTLQKSLALAQLPPGVYRVTIKVKDDVTGQTIAPATRFAVE